MPNYIYKCKKCGNEFEVFQSISAPTFTNCNQIEVEGKDCDGEIFRKIFGTGVILKGTGFYETDYVRKPETKKTTTTPAPTKTETPAKV